MPRPTPNDPNLCPGSDKLAEYEQRHGWLVCGSCGRTLKQAGAHRVRSRTTASMDRLRDGLLAAGIPPY